MQALDAVNHCHAVVHRDIGAKAIQRGNMSEAVFENGFIYNTGAVCQTQHCTKGCLRIGREAGMRLCDDAADTLEPFRGPKGDSTFIKIQLTARFHQRCEHRLNMRRNNTADVQGTVRGCRQTQIGGGNNAVGYHGMLCRMQSLNAVDDDNRGACTVNICAGSVQETAQIDDFRFSCRIDNLRCAI